MQTLRSRSIRTLLSLLVLVCVLPSLLVTIGVITYDYQREHRQLIDNTILTARSINGLVDQVFLGIEASLDTLGTSPTLQDPDRSRFYDQAQLVLKSQIGRNILLTDGHGVPLVNTLVPYGTALVQRSDRAQSARLSTTHAPVVSDLFRGATDNRQIVSVAVPVIQNGIHAYNISTRLLPSVFSNLLAQQGLSPDWVAAITDSSGTVVARTRDNDRFVGTKLPSNLLNTLLIQSEGSLVAKTLEGIPVIAVFSQSQITGWTVAIGIPLELLTKDLHRRLLALTFATSVVLLVGLSLAWLIGGRIIRANRGLIAPALALGEGKPMHVPIFGLREADEVGEALTKAAERLSVAQYKANHDNLTALPNRGLFYDVVTRHLRLAARNRSTVSLLFIDLDGFKRINDEFGHAAGDEILRLVAARLGKLVRVSDTSSRLGGDEFAVVLPDTGAEYAEIVAKKIVDGLSVPYEVHSQLLRISASIGIAAAGNSTVSVETLVRAADDAMYVAKTAGKARVHVSTFPEAS